MIQQVGPASYLVPSETQSDVSYLVDMDIRQCTSTRLESILLKIEETIIYLLYMIQML